MRYCNKSTRRRQTFLLPHARVTQTVAVLNLLDVQSFQMEQSSRLLLSSHFNFGDAFAMRQTIHRNLFPKLLCTTISIHSIKDSSGSAATVSINRFRKKDKVAKQEWLAEHDRPCIESQDFPERQTLCCQVNDTEGENESKKQIKILKYLNKKRSTTDDVINKT